MKTSEERKARIANTLREYRAILAMIHAKRPGMLAAALAQALLRGALPFIALVYGARILNQLIVGAPEAQIMQSALTMILLSFTANVIVSALARLSDTLALDTCNQTDIALARKCLTMDYQQFETRAVMEKLSHAEYAAHTCGGIHVFCQNLAEAAAGCFSLLYAFIALGFLFVPVPGAEDAPVVRALNSPLSALGLVAVVIACSLLCVPLLRRVNMLDLAYQQRVRPLSMLIDALFQLTRLQCGSKEMRAYGFEGMALGRHQSLSQKQMAITAPYMARSNRCWCLITLTAQLSSLFAYLFVGAKALCGLCSVGDVTLYVGAVTSLNAALQTVAKYASKMHLQRVYLKEYDEFLNLPSEKYNGTLPVEKRDDGDYAFEFRHVSFRYPGQTAYSLRDVSFRIRTGAKLAIVGPNGAGKTTFIKLLCRLYDPDEGEILLNGIDIKKYDYEEYLSLLSVVFQDFKLFSMSLGQNVAASAQVDEVRARDCLERAGFGERLATLPKGLDTGLYTDAEDGVSISGGEAQKIAIARALYKDAPLVILDEPTAALDPFSEYEIYHRFDGLIEGKTAIYISHRMSSCRFCDEIAVFDGGRIVQHGSHEALLADERGLYRRLWDAQAQYYSGPESRVD